MDYQLIRLISLSQETKLSLILGHFGLGFYSLLLWLSSAAATLAGIL